jgi:hypothetical protein
MLIIGWFLLFKKRTVIIGCTVFVLNFSFVAAGHCQSNSVEIKAGPPKEMMCRYTKIPPIINGRLNRRIWNWANLVRFQDDSLHSKEPGQTSNKVTVRTLWDNNNLYIAYSVQDSDLQATHRIQDSPGLASDDIVEFLIDPPNSKEPCWGPNDIIYHINLLGQKKDSRGSDNCTDNPKWNGHARYVIRLFGTLNDSTDIDKGYNIEIAIPWSEIHRSPHAGLRIGIDFANGDSGIFFDWAGAWPFRSPNEFGNLILKK